MKILDFIYLADEALCRTRFCIDVPHRDPRFLGLDQFCMNTLSEIWMESPENI